jgi:hypothetical protein
VRVLAALTVNPVACIPQSVPSTDRSVYENDDCAALHAAILINIVSVRDSLSNHVYGVYGAASRECFGTLTPRATRRQLRVCGVYACVMNTNVHDQFGNLVNAGELHRDKWQPGVELN